MGIQTWHEQLMSLDVDGPALNTFTTAKSIFGATTDAASKAKITVPPGFFVPGKHLFAKLLGDLSNIVTTPGTVTFQLMVGAVIAWTSGAINMPTTAHTALPFWLEIDVTCQANGAGTLGKLMGQGKIVSQAVAMTAAADSAALTLNTLLLPNTTPAQGTGFDTTVSNTIDVFAAFSISNAGNQVRVRQYELSAKN
jgi:hypothetical protein